MCVLLASQKEKVQPDPGEHQHDQSDRQTEDEPRAKVDDFRFWVPTETDVL